MKPREHGAAGITIVELLVTLVIIAALGVIAAPVILKQRKAADRTRAIGNLKQLGAMLVEFDTEYGRFPDDETAREVRRATKTDFTLTGPYSNDYFRQMLVLPGDRYETLFWCETAQSPEPPDNDHSSAAKALAAGEVGYSYIMASGTQGQCASGEPGRPVVVAPSFKFRADWTFDPEPFEGKAVVLRLDNSVTAMAIRTDDDKDEEVVTPAHEAPAEAEEPSLWGTGMTPVLRAPQPRSGGKK